ncbi:hypothetical protein DA075_25385 [Methylobacterium currus]|uniref:Polysaccharide chain length determinant N-terminal domain-containing protein n=1 Tax=Methylobacterium currus TaxID=2051553 RepID=A0A2R4WQK1_9HYPH|nr:hypothetical protein [Methylobacterium currus]AWB23812.1 hypothetical protein DA075_25385 [Methylobacterium currus]
MNAIPSLFGSEPEVRSDSHGFSVTDFRRLMRKHGLLILACFSIVTSLIAWGVARLPPAYTSRALVLVKLEQAGTPSFFSGIAAFRDSTTQDSANRRMENEMELAESWPLSADVVRALGLRYDQVYHPPLTHLMRPFADAFDRFVAPILGLSPDPDKRGFGETVSAFRASLDVTPVASKSSDTNSNIVSMQLRGTDPERTRLALEELITRFLRHDADENRETARKAQAVVARHAETAEAEVVAAQHRVETFLAALGGSAKPEQRELGTPRDPTTIVRLKARLQDLRMELLELRIQYAEPTEQTRALEGVITALTEELDREQRGVARSDAVLQRLERDLRLKESALMDLQKRLGQIALYLEMTEGEFTNRVVVEPPLKARSSDWKTRLAIAAAGSVASLFLGFALAGLRELVDPRLQTAAEARVSLGIPVLAAMPIFKADTIRNSFASLYPTTVRASLPTSVHERSS